LKPYSYQRYCLNALAKERRQGRTRSLVVMATGLGKTVVSAFDIQRLLKEAPGRVLFLCHDKRILRKSRKTYEAILGSKYTYGFFHGTEKHLHEVDVLFATFQTMANWREAFLRGEFRYIVVDEVHHGHAATFRPTIEYFDPEYWIGYTATPEREDGLDVGTLFGGKPTYELGVFKALARRYLCDVDYRIMTDEIQKLEVLDTPVGKLSIAELNRTIFVPKRDEEIVRIIGEKIAEVENPRTIIFCASIPHADRLATLMPHAAVVHSKLGEKENDRRLAAFASGEVDTILTVDMLNEGIDIPEANVIVFLRSTASRRIFLQQLGRGLRKALGKLKVLVLDFVANCERIEMIDQLQQGVEDECKRLNRPEPELDSNNEGAAPESRPAFTLTLDGGEFDERLWEVFGVISKIKTRQPFTIEVLTDQLLEKARQLGRTPTAEDVNTDQEMAHSSTFVDVFQTTWNGVLQAVGLSPVVVKRFDYSIAELTQQLIRKTEQLGRAPTEREVNADQEMAPGSAFRRTFGTTWNGVIERVGLRPTRKSYTANELTDQLRRKAEELGRTPTTTEVDNDPTMASSPTFRETFGNTWDEVIASLGLQPTRVVYTKEILTAQLINKATKLGRVPKLEEVNADPDMASAPVFLRVFDSNWQDMIKEVGLTPLSRNKFTVDELTIMLHRKIRALGRTPTIRDVRADPELPSSEVFTRTFKMTWNGVIKAVGLPPPS
jgi:superfamily II DNA or RNA helicase